MGQKFILHVVSILLVFGCIIIAGCSDLLTAEGPLTKYAFSSRTFPTPTHTPAPTLPLTIQTTSASVTLVPEQSPSVTIPVTPTEDPYSYHPLRVIPMAGDTVEYRTYAFRYRTDDYSLKVPVNTSIYRTANTSGNKQMIIDDREFGLFYQQMVADTGMEPFYGDILKEVRKLRYKGGKTLTDDEYLEMIVSFVQQIPYYDNPSGGVRFPIEVIYDQKGKCDEKSILLTGLLSREGYDVGLLLFPSLHHATAGIRIHLATNNPSFRVFTDGKRDYVYIETTADQLIGFYDVDKFKNAPQPIIVPVGSGTLNYGKVNYVMSIFYDLETIRTNIKTLEERAAANNNVLQKWDYDAYDSYIKTYKFVTSTNDREAAMEAIRESELPHQSSCMSCD